MKIALKVVGLMPERIQDRICPHFMKMSQGEISQLEVKVADSIHEYEEAARLVHECYVKRGLMAPHASGMRITAHSLLDTTTVFVAKLGDRVIATMSLIVDSQLGLPMDRVYADALAPLRGQGRRLAEVSALCVAEGFRRKGVTFLLNKLMHQVASSFLGIDDLVIAVHPIARLIYRSLLQFEQVGEECSYPGLNRSARAVALRLDLHTVERRLREKFGHLAQDASNPRHVYFGIAHPQIQVPKDGWLQRLRYVRRLAAARLANRRPDCIEELSPGERNVLTQIAPWLSKRHRRHGVAVHA